MNLVPIWNIFSSSPMLASSFNRLNVGVRTVSRPFSTSIDQRQQQQPQTLDQDREGPSKAQQQQQHQHVDTRSSQQASCLRGKTKPLPLDAAAAAASAKPFEAIPGPKPSLPVIGTGWVYLPLVGRYKTNRLHEAKLDQNKRYGPIMREEFSPGSPMVTIFEPNDIREVFKSEEGCPSRPVQEYTVKQRQEDKQRYSTVGLANLTGQDWAELRKILAPLLMSSEIKLRIATDQDRISNRLVDYLNHQLSQTKSNIVANIQMPLSRYAIESIVNLTISDKLRCLDVGQEADPTKLSQVHDGERIFAAAIEYFKSLHRLHYGSKLWRHIETPAYKDLRRWSNIMTDTAASYVDKLVEELEANREQVLKRPSSEHKSLTETLYASQKLSLLDIKSNVADFISGGIYTISSTLAMTLFLLATNPDCQEKLYSELEQHKLTGAGQQAKQIDLDKLERLKYLKLCLKESFRLLPTIPGVARTLQKDMVLAGYQVPKGTLVFCNTAVTCRLAQHFDQPMNFDPSRWDRGATGGGASKSDLVFALLPFGHGVRKCIGRPFAETELQMAVAKLIGAFKIEPVDQTTAESLELDFNFIVVPRNPISLKFIPRT